jgi:hypothetical protein
LAAIEFTLIIRTPLTRPLLASNYKRLIDFRRLEKCRSRKNIDANFVERFSACDPRAIFIFTRLRLAHLAVLSLPALILPANCE